MEQVFICKALLFGRKKLSTLSSRETAIATDTTGEMLNRRRELINRCLHKDSYKLSNFSTSLSTGHHSLPQCNLMMSCLTYSLPQYKLMMSCLTYSLPQSSLKLSSLSQTSLLWWTRSLLSHLTCMMES
jgi:hypothetical protein